MSIKNRRGVVEISDYSMVDEPEEKHLKALWSNVFPVKIEYQPWKHCYKIWGMSLLFKKIVEGDKIPEYTMEFTLNKDESVTVKAIEK